MSSLVFGASTALSMTCLMKLKKVPLTSYLLPLTSYLLPLTSKLLFRPGLAT